VAHEVMLKQQRLIWINVFTSNIGGKMDVNKVFIGSSSEGLEVARQVQVALEDQNIQVVVWDQGVFEPGKSYLSALLEATENFDFAVLVLTSDDTVLSRGDEYDAPRDNALIELGLFLGSIGRKRTFFMYDKSAPPKMASDLAGICGVTYYGKGKNLQAAVGSPCTIIRNRIRDLGPILKESTIKAVKNPRVLCVGGERLSDLGFAQDYKILQDSFDHVEGESKATSHWLRKKLFEEQFDIIHVCASVDAETGELILAQDDRMDAGAFGAAVKRSGACLVVLAGCDSIQLAEHVARITNMVAATRSAKINEFVEWEEIFYPLLSKGEVLSKVHDEAKVATGAPVILLPKTDVAFEGLAIRR